LCCRHREPHARESESKYKIEKEIAREREKQKQTQRMDAVTEAETIMETERDSQYKCMNRQSHISRVRIVCGVTGVSACVRDACMF